MPLAYLRLNLIISEPTTPGKNMENSGILNFILR